MQRHRQHLFQAKKKSDPREAFLVEAMEGNSSAKALVKGGALVQAMLCRKIPETSGLHLRFPLSFFLRRKTVPSLAWTPFLDAFKTEKVTKSEDARVGLFVGCGANYLFPETARALVRILEQMGINLIVPPTQTCCGLPAYASGDTARAQQLARKNIEAFESMDLDAILTVCASCGSHMNTLPSLFGRDTVTRDAAASLASKHLDAMTFLVDHLDVLEYLNILEPAEESREIQVVHVAYHDPCHLRIGQGTTEAPRQLLRAVPGVRLVEPAHPGRCCGHGGNFNLSHFSLSMNILERRIRDFEKVLPDRIATGCTGCLLQFAEGISQHGLEEKVEVCHPLVLVEEAIALCRNPTRQQKDLRGSQTQNTGPAQ
jgi:glycolate oxidase iron-sulfur subunit